MNFGCCLSVLFPAPSPDRKPPACSGPLLPSEGGFFLGAEGGGEERRNNKHLNNEPSYSCSCSCVSPSTQGSTGNVEKGKSASRFIARKNTSRTEDTRPHLWAQSDSIRTAKAGWNDGLLDAGRWTVSTPAGLFQAAEQVRGRMSRRGRRPSLRFADGRFSCYPKQ